MEERDWTFNIKLYHLKVAGYIIQNFSNNAFIVDCGCGWGQVGKILKYAGYEKFYGFDKNNRKVDIGLELGLHVTKANISHIPVPDNSADCVICMEVLEHLPDKDYKRGLKELNRIAKDTVIVEFPYGPKALEGIKHTRIVEIKEIMAELPDYKIVEESSVFGRFSSQEVKSHLYILERNNGTVI